jgi:hypothetical protein
MYLSCRRDCDSSLYHVTAVCIKAYKGTTKDTKVTKKRRKDENAKEAKKPGKGKRGIFEYMYSANGADRKTELTASSSFPFPSAPIFFIHVFNNSFLSLFLSRLAGSFAAKSVVFLKVEREDSHDGDSTATSSWSTSDAS